MHTYKASSSSISTSGTRKKRTRPQRLHDGANLKHKQVKIERESAHVYRRAVADGGGDKIHVKKEGEEDDDDADEDDALYLYILVRLTFLFLKTETNVNAGVSSKAVY